MKRARETSKAEASSKVAKLAPIFQRPAASSSDAAFKWLPSTKETASLLHGTHLSPPSRPKVALFDLDGTLIESSFGGGAKGGGVGGSNKGKGKADPLAWRWWRPVVPRKLKQLVDEGYAIVMISNQGIRPEKLIDWKKKIPLIASAIPEVPFHVFAATGRDLYRKPMPGMFYELQRLFVQDNVVIDMEHSFFVGDAAGRSGDFASTDRKWALNVGVPFYTPEEYFLGLQPAPYTLPGFHVSSLPSVIAAAEPPTPVTPLAALSLSTPTGSSTLPAPTLTPELILFVGPPAVGKTTYYVKHFSPLGHIHVNQDTLGSRPKCVKEVEEALKAKKSVVVDNTNRDRATRKFYVDLAKKAGVPVRCVLFTSPVELARHNNLYRAWIAPVPAGEKRRAVLPELALTTFKSAYEEPALDEGFAEIRRVSFEFEGTEEERKKWGMWLSVDK